MLRLTVSFIILTLSLPLGLRGQQHPNISGTWRVETPDGPTEIVVRADSSASVGEETVRWRIVGDSIHLAFGDEWIVYSFRLANNRLTLAGGDLEEPVHLEHIGPPKPRPTGVPVPPAPPADRRVST